MRKVTTALVFWIGALVASPIAAALPPAEGATLEVAEVDARALLNWAIYLSRYNSDVDVPQVRLEPTSFFTANACGGRSDCRVLGWYDDRDVVYVHERLGDMRSLFARSLLVHEFVHFLQDRSGRFASGTCESFVEREREAYEVQQRFFVAYGAMPNIQVHHFSCADVDEGLTLASGR